MRTCCETADTKCPQRDVLIEFHPYHVLGPALPASLSYSSHTHLLIQTVELVEAPPGPTLDEADKDPAHGLEVELLITIEYKHLSVREGEGG